MNKVFSYYRVSSKDQEENGVSLDAQREANIRFAKEHELDIIQEFREVQSASKGQRKEFQKMIKECHKLKAEIAGVIFHDVDRSARSWKDWAIIHELKELGFHIYFSREGMDMDGRGNMLTADIKAAIAADQIRNLRQEVKKSMYKKLQDGYAVIGKPLLGYIGKGGGVREVDPLVAPLIKECFKLYASGKYSLDMLAEKMYVLGLRSRSGGKVPKEKINFILKNKFYIGLIEVKGQIFNGRHEALISESLFKRVQIQLEKRCSPKTQKNDYNFLHLLTCGICGKTMRSTTAKKQYRYYSCRNKTCSMKNVTEIEVEQLVLQELERIKFTDDEVEEMVKIIKSTRRSFALSLREREKATKLALDNTAAKLSRLVDMQLTNPLPDDVFNSKRNQLVVEENQYKSQLSEMQNGESEELKELEKLIHLLINPVYAYKVANARNRVQLLQRMMRNITFSPNDFFFEWQSPFEILARRGSLTQGV